MMRAFSRLYGTRVAVGAAIAHPPDRPSRGPSPVPHSTYTATRLSNSVSAWVLALAPLDLYSKAVHDRGHGGTMAIQTTYTEARANLARLCDRVTDDRETVIIKRRGAADVALVAADELA